ncbi:hypothetical protein GALMADRAFT_127204 [Galerina marginata CBS 339.88]|uniref:Serine aminopeptidase S33 domain-containing protein n=1 Tax=Galerina marginata (strain CBS 339.88) TaxID=685588 RepID=A0A067SMW6_GALM3|nr:hypothetical protein GALMADRAFT_127204 [Galerina marginata CBS 339.88]
MVGFLKLLYYNQRVLVYPSGFEEHPRYVRTPDAYRMPYENVELVTKDKVKLQCHLIRQPVSSGDEARGTVIMFHGNAMNHGDVAYGAYEFFKKNFNVFTLEYRGYGHCEGSPSEKGLCIDAQAAVDYVLSDPALSNKPLIIYGQSLGGAVAIHATYKNSSKVAALIIENTFTSIPDIVKGWPVIRHFSFLCTQKWKSASKVSQLPTTLPILMLSGLADQVIPCSHMKALWDVASTRSQPKKKKKGKSEDVEEEYKPPQNDIFKSFNRGRHNTTDEQPKYWETLFKFLDNVLSAESS